MVNVVLVFGLLLVVGEAAEVQDVQYYSMPSLYQLDDYDECLASGGAFCLGAFHLSSTKYNRLLDFIQIYSKDKYHFNRTVINRGYCVTTSCSHIDGESLPYIFEECVQNITKMKYGLNAELSKLEYCKSDGTPWDTPLDTADMVFVVITCLIAMANLAGTAYDLLRNPNNKPNRYLMTWSARVNWRRLTATYEKENPELCALNPVNGMKALTLFAVIVAHSVVSYHMTYIQNPKFLETAQLHPMSTFLYNGTCTVQTFIMLSSFLLGYNLLLSLDADPKKKMGIAFWSKVLLHRLARITPVSIFMVGFSATWWSHAGDGPLWSMVGDESDRCRKKWWTHALYLNNLVMPDERCLIQTWFLAVDMQLYLVTLLLLVWLLHRPRTAVKVLPSLFIISVLIDFAVTYNWNLKTLLFIAYPEVMRYQFDGQPSFTWQHAAPWSSAPAAFLGLLVAFVYYLMRKANYNLHESTYYRVLYRVSVPSMLLWMVGGILIRDTESKFAIALYSALHRPVFSVFVSTAMIGFFYKIDYLWWRFLSWRGWQILGRMSLSVLMVHWNYNLLLLAVKTNLAHTSVFEITSHSLSSAFWTYLTALPLHIFLELPAQKFLEALFI